MEVKRDFIPGSEWLYFKIYTGIRNGERLLTDMILPSVENLLKEKVITEFFFIRYSDPDFHIRLRLKLADTKNFNKLFLNLFNVFENAREVKLLWKIQCDTYRREIERYGDSTIEVCEKIFFIDSTCVIEAIKLCQDMENTDQSRWLFALFSIDRWLECFEYTIAEKAILMKKLSDSSHQEFGLTQNNSLHQLNRRYQENKLLINQFLSVPPEKFEYIIQERNQKASPLVDHIKKQLQEQPTTTPLICDLVASIIHMSMNRLFRCNNRMCELVIYHYMSKYYESVIARLKNNVNE